MNSEALSAPRAAGLLVSIHSDRTLDSIKQTAEDFLRIRFAQFLFGEHLQMRSPGRFEFIVKNIAVQNVGSPHIKLARDKNTPSVCWRLAIILRWIFTKFDITRNTGSIECSPSRLRVYFQVAVDDATVHGINFRAIVVPGGPFGEIGRLHFLIRMLHCSPPELVLPIYAVGFRFSRWEASRLSRSLANL